MRLLPAKVTEKGQFTIPKDIRDAAGIMAGTEVEFERRNDSRCGLNGPPMLWPRRDDRHRTS